MGAIKPVKVGGHIVDWRDSSSFDVVVAAGQIVSLYVSTETIPCVLDVYWGDGGYNQFTIDALPTSPNVFTVYSHKYSSAGTCKVIVRSNVLLNGLNCSSVVSRYNAGYGKQINKIAYLYLVGGTTAQDFTSYLGVLRYLALSTTPIKIDLSTIVFASDTSLIQIQGINPNLYGMLRVPNVLLNVRNVLLYGSMLATQGVYSFNEVIANTPNATYYDIESYSGSTTIPVTSDLADTASLIATRPYLEGFVMLGINKGVKGNASALFKNLFERSDIAKVYINGAPIFTTELGSQTSDFYSHASKNIYLNNVTGNVSNFEWRYNAVTYIRIDTISTAYGNLNKIANVRQLGESQLTALYLYIQLSPSVSLDIANIRHIRANSIALGGGNNLSGDVSTLADNCQYCLTFLLTNITSTTITGWSELVTGIYDKRAILPTAIKTFNCPNVMKNALTGVYQAPAAFVKGSADGAPTTDRERIYVLVNNYNWVFTNV